MSLTKVLVFGATGAQGNPVAKQLIEQNVKVRAVSRNAEKVWAMFGERVEAAPADLADVESLKRAFDGVDAAFFHLPIPTNPADVPQQLENVLRAARDTGLQRLVFTTSGATDERLREIPFVAGNLAAASAVLSSGVPAVVLKPTIYLENLLQPWAIADITERGVLNYPPLMPSRRISWTGLQDQAKFAVAALTSEKAAGNSYFIASPEPVTGAELATRLAAQIRREVRYEPLTPEQFGAGLAQAYGEEAGAGIAAFYAGLDSLPPDGAVVDLMAAMKDLPVELTSVSEWVLRQNWLT